MFSGQKLSFEMSDEPSDLTLEQAFCGACGTVRIGQNGVSLWVPGDDVQTKENELIFDIRSRPLNDHDSRLFKEACKGHFMSTYIALMASNNPERIKFMLEHFDYVLVPEKSIKNTPEDFMNRVLSYTPSK